MVGRKDDKWKLEGMSEFKESAKTETRLSNRTLLLVVFFSISVALGTAFLLFSSFSDGETEPTQIKSNFIEFYGRECPHCRRMASVVAEVEAEANVTFSKLEVWHNSGNAKVFERYADRISKLCGGLGVPTFYNLRTGDALCGEVEKEELLDFVRSG